MRAFFREPLLHFLLLAAAIFSLYAAFDDSPAPIAENSIVVTQDEARRLAAGFERVWRRRPTPDELDNVVTQYIREEVYVREALALGLDQGDQVIRRRLQLKMEFLTESGAETVQPDAATLQAHLEANAAQFREPPLIAFEHLLLDGKTGPEELAAALASLNAGSDPDTLARPSLLPPSFRLAPPRAIEGTFGAGFFDAIAAFPIGQWAGPVKTGFGQHLVRVTERKDARLLPLAQIRERVEQDWRMQAATALREARFKALLSRYEVIRPDAAAVLAP
jgi:hypothetical protein